MGQLYKGRCNSGLKKVAKLKRYKQDIKRYNQIAADIFHRFPKFDIPVDRIIKLINYVHLKSVELDNLNVVQSYREDEQELINIYKRLREFKEVRSIPIKFKKKHFISRIAEWEQRTGNNYIKDRNGLKKELASDIREMLLDYSNSKRQAEYITGYLFEVFGIIDKYASVYPGENQATTANDYYRTSIHNITNRLRSKTG